MFSDAKLLLCPVSCLVKSKYGDKVGSEYDLCDGDPGWHEDTAIYQAQWKPALEESNDTWKFHSAHTLGRSVCQQWTYVVNGRTICQL